MKVNIFKNTVLHGSEKFVFYTDKQYHCEDRIESEQITVEIPSNLCPFVARDTGEVMVVVNDVPKFLCDVLYTYRGQPEILWDDRYLRKTMREILKVVDDESN